MTPRAPGDGDAPSAWPFRDDRERAEAAWLLARDLDPTAAAPSPELAADHAELADLLASLPAGDGDERWQADVLRAARAMSAPRRPWWRTAAARWTAAGALAAAAGVALVVRAPHAAVLEIAVRHRGTSRGSDTAALGDRLVITARPERTGDLRVYRADGVLVARCPGGPTCPTGAPDPLVVELTLDAPVSYQVILVDQLDAALPGGAMDVYVDAARAAHARITLSHPIDVR
jgi:hypothetical protein